MSDIHRFNKTRLKGSLEVSKIKVKKDWICEKHRYGFNNYCDNHCEFAYLITRQDGIFLAIDVPLRPRPADILDNSTVIRLLMFLYPLFLIIFYSWFYCRNCDKIIIKSILISRLRQGFLDSYMILLIDKKLLVYYNKIFYTSQGSDDMKIFQHLLMLYCRLGPKLTYSNRQRLRL